MPDSEDMDVYVQAAYVFQQLHGDLLIKHNNALINCCDMLLEEVADVMIPIHIITGCGHTSAFYGHGKIIVLEKVCNDLGARLLLKRVGDNLELQNEI